jgi:hypothetical protein
MTCNKKVLQDGGHQARLMENCPRKTVLVASFSSRHLGLFQYSGMTIGHENASAFFQQHMNRLPGDCNFDDSCQYLERDGLAGCATKFSFQGACTFGRTVEQCQHLERDCLAACANSSKVLAVLEEQANVTISP